ncbi:MAG: hypothetical protein JW395_0360 [Nitrospira sp.]|nr:hypothetical protein [Nitrospira sp.]
MFGEAKPLQKVPPLSKFHMVTQLEPREQQAVLDVRAHQDSFLKHLAVQHRQGVEPSVSVAGRIGDQGVPGG